MPERVRAIVNRRSGIDAISDKDFTDYLGREANAFIPNDYVNTVNSVNEGRPVSQVAPRSALDQAFRDLASKTHEWCGLEVPQTAVSAVSGVKIDTRAYQSTETTESRRDEEEEEEEEPDCELAGRRMMFVGIR